MNFYAIKYSLDKRIYGTIEQVKEIKHNCHVWDDPNFIDRFPFLKIEINPILSTPILDKNAKLTDVIMTGGIGFSYGSLLISDRFKKMLDSFNCSNVQFFKTSILHDENEYDNYWQTHFSNSLEKCIDFNKTTILLKERGDDGSYTVEMLTFKDYDDFLKFSKKIKYPKIALMKRARFLIGFDQDFFLVRYFENNTRGIVSEKLKTHIEKEKITGIEFEQVDLA